MHDPDSNKFSAVCTDWQKITGGTIKHVYRYSDPILQDGISFVIIKDGKEMTLTIRIPYDTMPECAVDLAEW